MGSPDTNAIATRSQSDGSGCGAGITLGECMASSTRRYLADLNGTPCREGLYARMLREIELPLLREVLEWSGGNQSRAAEVLGIHRATLRKKLRELGIG
jgi:Fis family transcriptional regulator